jgi:hypothetical protein
VVGYGGWEAGDGYYGENPADADMMEAMQAGFEAGINSVDTPGLTALDARSRSSARRSGATTTFSSLPRW